MNTRIRQIRTDNKLSQKAFGERIQLSRNTINDIEAGRQTVKDYMVRLICDEYHVNEEWLRTGKGEMYTDKMTDDQTAALIEQFGLEGIEAKIARAYLELDHETRMYVINHFRKYLEDVRAHPEEDIDHPEGNRVPVRVKVERVANACENPVVRIPSGQTVEEAEEEYKKNRLNAVKKKEQSASSTTGEEGINSKNKTEA